MTDEVQKVREGVAKELGIALYKAYGEQEAAHFLGLDLTTLKRMRRDGKTPYVALSERKIRYLGIHICDLYAYGEKWPNIVGENSKSGNTGLVSEKEARLGTEQVTTRKLDAQTALALTRMITKSRNKP